MSAFKSRASLLLEKQFFRITREKIWGIHAEPFEENIFHWEALISGPKETAWDGGVFKLYLIFNEEYDLKAPEIFFHSIPFHPNVDMTSGKPCVEYLDDSSQWKSYYGIQYMLLSLQTLLAFPVLENAVNEKAADLYRTSPQGYEQMVKDCVSSTKRLSAGLPPFLDMTNPTKKSYQIVKEDCQARSSKKPAARVSFEDYHALWSEMATSHPGKIDTHMLSNLLKRSLQIDAETFNVMRDEVQDELRQQMLDHNAMMYGKFQIKKEDDSQRIVDLQATRLKLLGELQRLREESAGQHLKAPVASAVNIEALDYDPVIPRATSGFKSPDEGTIADEDDEPSDQEVLDLVAWSNNLPA